MCKVRNLIWSECKLGRGRSQSKKVPCVQISGQSVFALIRGCQWGMQGKIGRRGGFSYSLAETRWIPTNAAALFALALLALARHLPLRTAQDASGWRVSGPTPVSFSAFPRRSARALSLPPSRERGGVSTCPEPSALLPPPGCPHCARTSPLLWSRNIPLLILPRACHVLFTPTEDARRQKSIFFFSTSKMFYIFGRVVFPFREVTYILTAVGGLFWCSGKFSWSCAEMGGDKIFNIVIWYRKRKVYAQKHSVEVLRGWHKTSAVTTREACLCSDLLAAVSAQLRPAAETPVLFAGRPGPLLQSEPLLYPQLGTPFLSCPTVPGPRGKHRRACGPGCPPGPGWPRAGTAPQLGGIRFGWVLGLGSSSGARAPQTRGVCVCHGSRAVMRLGWDVGDTDSLGGGGLGLED